MDKYIATHKMHLYLKNGEKQRWLIVQLVEGHSPRIAGLSTDDTDNVTDSIEPAIWFKVMVLESISIDCMKRIVYWTNGIKDNDGVPCAYSMYGGDSCYDFDDDIDELFNIAHILIETNPLAEPNDDRRQERVTEYEHSLFRMLHCYILSKIMLRPADIECVRSALKSQNKAIAQLGDVTLMHSRLAEHYLAQMRNLREVEVLPVFESLLDNHLVSKELLNVLSYDLKKSEPILRAEVDNAQGQVDHLKQMISIGASSARLSHDLGDARRHRDSVLKSLENLLMGKELVFKALQLAELNKEEVRVELNEICRQYIKLHRRVQDEKKISQVTISKKIRAISVRECIESILKDLIAGHVTSGEEMTVDGHRPTDIMDTEKPHPEWQTLSQRLSAIVHNREHPVGRAFIHFTQELDVRYRKVLRTVESIWTGSSKFMSSFDGFYVISQQDMGLNAGYIEDQKNLIQAHLSCITQVLGEHFRSDHMMLMRKIRLCYEKCFYNRVGRELTLVYRVVNGKQMQAVEKRITMLKDVPICKLGLQMRDEWWLQLFEPESEEQVSEEGYESTDEELSESPGGYGDDENSDYDSEDYCTDSEGDPFLLTRTRTNEENMKRITDRLKQSKEKVLSRSMDSDLDRIETTSAELMSHNAKLLKQEVDESVDKVRHKFNSTILPYLKEEEVDEKLQDGPVSSEKNSSSTLTKHTENDSFDIHFGPALKSIKNIFTNSSPLKKMQCLTTALRFIATKVEELRMRGEDEEVVDRAKVAVTAEDLLPLLVLILLKMSPVDVAKLYVELVFVFDFMADFLSSGCHSYALCEFQIAFRVLDQTCDELSF